MAGGEGGEVMLQQLAHLVVASIRSNPVYKLESQEILWCDTSSSQGSRS